MGIAAKLVAVMGEIERIAKNGRNDFHKYDYVTEADLVEGIRNILVAYGVAFFPTVKAVSQTGDITQAELEFQFIDSETNETFTSTFWGAGQDKSDKGMYKAYTGAVKYALMKTFLVPTGEADDPEHDGKTPAKRPDPKLGNKAQTGAPTGTPPAKAGLPPLPGPNTAPPKPAEDPSIAGPDLPISAAQQKHVIALAEQHGWSPTAVKTQVLSKYDCKQSSEIKNKDYEAVVADLLAKGLSTEEATA